jgi:hypothetical protein
MTGRDSNSVIEFPANRVRAIAPREEGAPAAEVLIFTGVRIERMPEDPKGIAAPRPGLSRRGRRARR